MVENLPPQSSRTTTGTLLCHIAVKVISPNEDKKAHADIIRSVDVGVCANSYIHAILQEWRHPRHDAFAPRNVWSLFNAFTEALKGNLIELPRRTEALHGLLDHHVGFEAE